MLKNKKAVILDLDGTIINSGFVWHKVDVDFFAKRGMEIPKDYTAKINSMSFYETAVFTKREYGIAESVEEIMEEWYNMAAQEYAQNVRLKDGAGEFIQNCRKSGLKIGLATATSNRLFIPCLKNNGVFGYFDAHACGDEVKKSKEFPDIYLLCAKRLKCLPEDCIVFEDIARGIRGAKKAGMATCGVYDEYTEYEWQIVQNSADYSIKSFKELI